MKTLVWIALCIAFPPLAIATLIYVVIAGAFITGAFVAVTSPSRRPATVLPPSRTWTRSEALEAIRARQERRALGLDPV